MSSKYQLYYSPGACSLGAHVLLRELNQPVDLIRVDLSAPREESFLKISPRGQVPVLIEDGMPIYEGAAIMIHLCEKFCSPLLPAEGVLRGKALQALMFFNASVHPAYSKFAFVRKAESADSAREDLKKEACAKIQEIWDLVDTYLADSAYLAGDSITVADILMTVIANWDWISEPPVLGENVKRVIREVSQRPAFQAALEAENVEYRAAA